MDGDCMLRKAVEKLPSIAGPTPVEPKREFVEVVFQVLMAHPSLMSPQNPALQQRRDTVHPRQQFRRGFLLALQEGYFMRVASPFERIVADPPVSMHGAAWLNRLIHELHQAVRGRIRNPLNADPPDARPIVLGRDHNQGLALRLSAAHSLLQTTQIRFVHLYPTRQTV